MSVNGLPSPFSKTPAPAFGANTNSAKHPNAKPLAFGSSKADDKEMSRMMLAATTGTVGIPPAVLRAGIEDTFRPVEARKQLKEKSVPPESSDAMAQRMARLSDKAGAEGLIIRNPAPDEALYL